MMGGIVSGRYLEREGVWISLEVCFVLKSRRGQLARVGFVNRMKSLAAPRNHLPALPFHAEPSKSLSQSVA
jgi:hypothetical protein